MAYGDISALLPAETLYTGPGTYREAARAEATKRATYLSQMDQFYEELEEMKREFDKRYSLELKEFEAEKEYREEYLGLQKEQLALSREQMEREAEMGEKYYGLERERLRLQRNAADSWGEYKEYETTSERLERLEAEAGGTVPLEWFQKQVEAVTTPQGAPGGGFPGAGSAVYSPSGELMIAGGSEASYDIERRKRYASPEITKYQ